MSSAIAQNGIDIAPSELLPKELKDFRGYHAGKTFLVCGCGSSLSQVVTPERFITIGVNDVGRLFDPDYLVVLNPRNQFQGDRFRFVAESRARAVFTQLDLGISHPHIVRIRLGKFGGVDFSDPAALPFTRNSPYVALCLAVHMGAQKIGLIGVDFTDDHFFAKTGQHPLMRELPQIDAEYKRLHAACVSQGVEIFNLSAASRLTAFPKLSFADFADTEKAQESLQIVSYATTPVAGVPAILARCINGATPHHARTVWATNTYGNGVTFEGDVEWHRKPSEAHELLSSADIIVVHNGKVDPAHRSLVDGKPVITMAHNYIWNVDTGFVDRGYPGVVVGQYQATLPEFKGWQAVPNPVPLWEEDYKPGPKNLPITICFTPSGKHERYPAGHRLYWHSKGYDTTVRVLQDLARRYPLRLEIIGHRQVSHNESLAMKRRAHIVIDECVTGSYHRNSLEGLACGCVVVNALGQLPAAAEMFQYCAGGPAEVPFVYAELHELENVLARLVENGHEELVKQGTGNRSWMEKHWDFRTQWQCFWEPAVESALKLRAGPKRPMIAVHQASSTNRPGIRPEIVMDKVPKGVSVVVPHGGQERLPHLAQGLANLRQCDGVSEIVVVEMDYRPVAEDVSRSLADKYVFLRKNDAFEKSRCLNVGMAVAECDFVLWKDNDLLVPADFVSGAAAEMHARKLDYLIPYVTVNYLSEQDSRKVIEQAANPSDFAVVKSLRGGSQVHGGAGLVRKSFVLEYGGFPDQFRGWGGEDSAFWHKATLFGCAGVTQRQNQHLYHLYHVNSGGYGGSQHRDTNPHYSKNLATLTEMWSIRDRRTFLNRFPPTPLLSINWSSKKVIFVQSSPTSQAPPPDEIGRELTNLTRVEIEQSVACAQGGDAIVIFGLPLAASFLSDPNIKKLRQKIIAVDTGAGIEDSSTPSLRWVVKPRGEASNQLQNIVLGLLQPLSIILGDPVSSNASSISAAEQAPKNSIPADRQPRTGVILLTGLYEDPDPNRRNELFECLKRNIENTCLEEIHLFAEDSVHFDRIQSPKIHVIAHGRRVTYHDLFSYANNRLPGRRVIIANADIFFDDSLTRLTPYDLSGRLLCLSRWDVQTDGSSSFFRQPASQDAWIFDTPIREFTCDFHLGVPGCDNRLAWEAERAGLALSNPARSLRANHLHLSGVRRYSQHQRLAGPMRSVPADFLAAPRPGPNLPCASVAFSEAMGYTVAHLCPFASSHNNDSRPFASIPEPLAGLKFTQVVACSASPIEVEFLTPRKLYVLVGTDWEGYWPATTWLIDKGFKENLPPAETRRGTAFEVWSLTGEAGDRFVLPTQVMLAARDLVKDDGQSRRKRVAPPPTRHLLIAPRHKTGLWSMFFQVIGLIRYAERHGLEPVVYFNEATCWWSREGYNGSRNAWEYFFEPVGKVSASELLAAKSLSLEHASLSQLQAALPDDVVMSDYILDHVDHYDHTEVQRQEYASIVQRCIRVKSQVLAKLNPALITAMNGGCTAVHYRGTDKFRESARQAVNEYDDAIQNRVAASHKLFVATDAAPFLERMIGTYGERVLYTQAARSHDQTALHFGPYRGPRQAEECLLDVLLMAKCQHLVHGNSSVTNGVLVFNPTMTHDALHARRESEKPA
jgi:hypothetical protein